MISYAFKWCTIYFAGNIWRRPDMSKKTVDRSDSAWHLTRSADGSIDGIQFAGGHPAFVLRDGTPEQCEAVVRQLNAMATAVSALEDARRLHEQALPKFNWGASVLDAPAITLLNEVPGKVTAALRLLDAYGIEQQGPRAPKPR